ncbi:MAG: DUF2791 family P-loop domain-containing protein, partial [Actinobacteria bacterium]|nr:DUF2791 family P-loop domain-containing protein [Actinomycetota bacterium]
EDRFTSLLDSLARGGPALDRRGGAAPRGLLLGGGFGGGKSHLLTHFAHLAMSGGFAVSTVVISKETPLHDPAKMFRSAITAAVGPGRGRGVLATAAAQLDPDTPRYAELSRWVNSPASGLDERFPATLLCHERLRGGEMPSSDETSDALVRFWGGDPIGMADLRRALKSVGAAGLFSFSSVSARELARQRFRFAAALLRAAGLHGWVILFDEVELIGRYSLLQRGRSYAELGRWLGGDDLVSEAPLAAVFAMTDDFEAAVLTGKNDSSELAGKLRAKLTPEWDETATFAEAGMRRIEHDMLLLDPPDSAELDRTYHALKQLHGAAYQWAPPDVPGLERLSATRMRQYVRAWINEWDLVRLDAGYQPDTVATNIASDYREDLDIEGSGPPSEPPDKPRRGGLFRSR